MPRTGKPAKSERAEGGADLAKLAKPAALRKLYLAVFSALAGRLGEHWTLDADTADSLAQLTHDTVKYYWPKMEPENPAVSLGIALGVVLAVRLVQRKPATVRGDRSVTPAATAAGDRPQSTERKGDA